MSLKEAWHDKHNRPAFVVQLETKVDRHLYDDLNRKAKQLGGYYSSFRGGRALPGFQFQTKADAERFMSLQEGDVDRSHDRQERQQERQQGAAERLHDAAERLQEKAEESLGRERASNTVRRAGMAAQAQEQARKELAFAQTLTNVAEAIATGSAKHLTGIRTKAQVETLDTLLRQAKTAAIRKAHNGGIPENAMDRPVMLEDVDHTPYPFPQVSKEHLLRILNRMKDQPGAKQLAARLAKMANASEWLVQFTRPSDLADFNSLIAKAERADLSSYEIASLKDAITPYNRLQAIGIESLPELRAALRQLLPLMSIAQGEDPVQALERALVGRTIDGFFPTPRSVIDRMLAEADIRPGMSVLEPSAGKGDIADAVRGQHAAVDAVELVQELRDILQAKGHKLVGRDFLQHEGMYDRILMNPPFERGQDMAHVRKAYEHLRPCGRLVAVMSEGPFFRQDADARAFREWLSARGGTSEQMPEAFKGPDVFRQTGVNSRLVMINKPA